MNDFFFHRPWWFLALIPLITMRWLLKRKKQEYSNWQEHIDSHLMPQVIQTLPGTKTNNLLNIYLMAWLIAILVLAGPSWQKTPPITLKADVAPLILILDLSRSMLVRDISPDRLSITKAKVQQLLQQLPPRPVTLIVYSAMAHQVIPLTEDYQLVYNLLEFMHPDLMPAQGSNSAAGFDLAAKLLQQNTIPKADLLLLSDAADKNSLVIVEQLSQQGHRTLVYAIGTENGAYIPDTESGYLRQNGQPVPSVLDSSSLQSLAQAGQGLYQEVTKNSDDIQHLLAAFAGINKGKIAQDGDGHNTTAQVWQDQAAWLIVLLLPLVLVLFKPGLLAIIVCFALFISSSSYSPVLFAGSGLYAGSGSGLYSDSGLFAGSRLYATGNAGQPSLWLNQQQKALLALQEKRFEEAENLFQSPLWRGIAQYKQQKYLLALESFAQLNTAEACYNHGNTLVKLERYQDALLSYQKALNLAADFQPARHNYDLLKKMLQQAAKNKSQTLPSNTASKEKKKSTKTITETITTKYSR